MTSDYRVQLDVFTGPLDLLLYLIRRDELDVQDIAVARVTDQYIEYTRLLNALDPNAAGEFLVLAATLLEMKSRALLPTPPLDLGEDGDDPRATLVRELLEYKRFKDAARRLGSAADERAKRYVRVPAELPRELAGVELEDVQLWDLVAAFGRVMTAIGQGPSRHEVTYDDTPIELWADEIVAALHSEGPTTFQALFAGRSNRAEVVGLFLALLELVRSHRIKAEQERAFGTIYLFELVEAPDEPAADTAPTSADATPPEPAAAAEAPTERDHEQAE